MQLSGEQARVILGAIVARFDALNRLWENVRESSHDFRSTTEIFPPLDREKVASSLELRKYGAERGSDNQPPPSAKAFDEVEQAVIARIEEEKRTSFQVLEDQFETFDERLRNLDFEDQLGLIRQANTTSLSDFKAAVKTGANLLHGLRKALKIAENELCSFERRNKLQRAARVSSGAWYFAKIAVIVLLLLIETIFNGNFLAVGSERGLLGGVVEAFTFAFLNIMFSLIFGLAWVRFITHHNIMLKLFGFIGGGSYIVFAVTINLALAHYRELAEVSRLAEASGEVMVRLASDPFTLTQLSSWTLFGVGLLFSIIAFFDGLFWTDPYPGFANVQKRLNSARDEYTTQTEDLVDSLRDVRDDHNAKVDEIIRELSQRRREAAAIIKHRDRTIKLFREHQNHLERTANELLTFYHDANRKARTEAEPPHFSEAYKMEAISVTPPSADEKHADRLAKKIDQAQEELSVQIASIGQAFEEAIAQYRQLDDIAPEDRNGSPQTA